MQNLGVNPNIELRLNLWITHRYVLILLDEPCPSRRKKEGIFTLRFLFFRLFGGMCGLNRSIRYPRGG